MQEGTTEQLAALVWGYLRSANVSAPAPLLVKELLDVLFRASLRTEEGEAIKCYVVWLDPVAPDPSRPRLIFPDRWTFVPLASSIELTIPSLTKLARSTDARASWIAVHPDANNRLRIWGLVDQVQRYHDHRTFIGAGSYRAPGTFQIRVSAPGELVAYALNDRIAELRVDRIVRHEHEYDALWRGPVHTRLLQGFPAGRVPAAKYSMFDVYAERRTERLKALARLLLAAKSLRHGAAYLITHSTRKDRLASKYAITYRRVGRLAVDYADVRVKHRVMLHSFPHASGISAAEFDDFFLTASRLDKASHALQNAIWFVAMLTRVDGAVVMKPNLDIVGYGTEILVRRAPSAVWLARDEQATESKLVRADYNHFGTRHRSMMRYCAAVDDALGFVVSQDGDVRVVAKIDGRLILWENLRLGGDKLLKFEASITDGLTLV